MNQNILLIITGTTQGLGNELVNVFNNQNILTINRQSLNKSNNLVLDLASNDILFDELNRIIKVYDKIFFISNASIVKPIKRIRDLASRDLDIAINTNFVNPSKIILEIVKSEKAYVILNITSGAAFTSNADLSLYSSSKASMHRFIEILKIEEESNPNALFIENFDPGRMQTKMQKDLINEKRLQINIKDLSSGKEVAQEIYQILGKYI